MHSKTNFLLIISSLILAGCGVETATPNTTLPEFVTATLPPTATPFATHTPLPPTAAPTTAPITGRTTTEVNLRQGTSTASPSLGTIPAFSNILITGKDASGLWVQVTFNGSTGWVRADYVLADDATAEIPVLGAEAVNGFGFRGVVLRGVNIRSGPGTNFDSLGLLNQNDVVPVTGRDSSGGWFQVEYQDGTGWIAAEFLQVENVEAIPVVNADPQVSEPSEVTPQAEVSSPLQIAQLDHDSQNAPLAVFTLGENIGKVLFHGDVSAPAGDTEDWLGFSGNSKEAVIQILCSTGSPHVELIKPDKTLEILLSECNTTNTIPLVPGQAYLLKISTSLSSEFTHTKYQIKLESVFP